MGDIISNDMSPHPLLKQAEVKSWAAFWRNSGSSLARHLTVTQRVKQNQKMVWPCYTHCISRVPPSKSNLTRIQQHQNKMTKIMLQQWPRSDESPETFVKRVNASISYLNRSVSWSKLVVKMQPAGVTIFYAPTIIILLRLNCSGTTTPTLYRHAG